MNFQAVREKAAGQYSDCAFPASIALALSVECGEVSGIFQWKGTMETNPSPDPPLTAKEIEHIGDAMAGVLIYTTRLSDICGIDIVQAILRKAVGHTFLSTSCRRQDVSKKWDNMALDDLKNHSFVSSAHYRSQRHVCFHLLAEAGIVCALFAKHPESLSGVGLSSWRQGDVEALAGHLAAICLLLGGLSRFSDHSLQKCVADRFAKESPALDLHDRIKYIMDNAYDKFCKQTADFDRDVSAILKNAAVARESPRKEEVSSWLPVRWATLGRYALIGVGTVLVAGLVFKVGFNVGLHANFRREIEVTV